MSRNPRLKLSLPPPAASGRERSDDIEEREEERWTWKVSAPEKKEEEEKEEESEEEEECDVTRVYMAKRAGARDHGRQRCPLRSFMVEGGNLCPDCFS